MSASDISLNNLDDSTCNESEEIPQLIPAEIPSSEASSSGESASLPSIGIDDIKNVFNSGQFSNILQEMTQNPNEFMSMVESSIGRINPEMMEQARKMAMGGQGNQILKEMQKRGMDPYAMKSKLKEHQRAIKGLGTKKGPTKKAVIVTMSRKIKSRDLVIDSIEACANSILHSTAAVELVCSRLAQGPLKNKSIRVWYDPRAQGKNRRASKIIGFNVGGDILVAIEDGDLTEKDFCNAEKCIE